MLAVETVCFVCSNRPSSSLFSTGTLQAMRFRAARPSSATIFRTLSWLVERWKDVCRRDRRHQTTIRCATDWLDDVTFNTTWSAAKNKAKVTLGHFEKHDMVQDKHRVTSVEEWTWGQDDPCCPPSSSHTILCHIMGINTKIRQLKNIITWELLEYYLKLHLTGIVLLESYPVKALTMQCVAMVTSISTHWPKQSAHSTFNKHK